MSSSGGTASKAGLVFTFTVVGVPVKVCKDLLFKSSSDHLWCTLYAQHSKFQYNSQYRVSV